MANITVVTDIMLLCVILLSCTHGENNWRGQLRERLARASETSNSFWSDASEKPQASRGSKSRTTIEHAIKAILSAADRSSTPFTDFQNQALTQTNIYRVTYCAPKLILNSTICSVAQAYANLLAKTGVMQHSNNPNYGENLYSFGSSQPTNINSVNGSTPVNYWFNEVNQYNWSSPGFSSATGHFTQLVWASTTQFGIGIACQSDYTTCFIVANYWLPGNIQGQFQINVKPKGMCT